MPLILTVTPDQIHLAQPYNLRLAHMAYRIGPGPHLLRASIPVSLRGGYMVISDQQFDTRGDLNPFLQEVVRECSIRSFEGVICDFEGSFSVLLGKLISALGEGLARRNLPLFVTEAYASSSNHAKVIVSSAISGGSLRQRLKEVMEQYGEKRVAMTVERMAEDFYLPAPGGTGTTLTQEELKNRIARRGPSIYFSSELCAHYFTYMNRDSGAHFVLFDDASSIRKKIQIAHQAGITDILLVYAEVDDLLTELLE
ncbi:MAG: hypothetical protein H6Q60_606 [Oscillospiraceae bacterium]|nr:hypothetical protein [Oscillospiraceae bacterium]